MIKSAINKAGILCYWDDVLNAIKVKSPLEHIEQINLVAHCKQLWPNEFNVMLHVPNESNVPVQYRAKLSRCGLLKGASDWLILWPSNGRPYMLVELKRSRKKDSAVSNEQVNFLLSAQLVGAEVCVAYGYKAALHAIEKYLK